MSTPEPDAPTQEYVYFVSFWGRNPDGSPSLGTAEVLLRTPITTMEHVREAQQWIEQETGFPRVGVLNFILLRTQERPA